MDWILLTNPEQLDDIKNRSKTSVVGIFKHSTRCGISTMVLKQFERAFTSNIPMYLLDLLNHRDISNQIAQNYQITHKSPQLLLILNNTVLDYASHSAILDIDFTAYKK